MKSDETFGEHKIPMKPLIKITGDDIFLDVNGVLAVGAGVGRTGARRLRRTSSRSIRRRSRVGRPWRGARGEAYGCCGHESWLRPHGRWRSRSCATCSHVRRPDQKLLRRRYRTRSGCLGISCGRRLVCRYARAGARRYHRIVCFYLLARPRVLCALTSSRSGIAGTGGPDFLMPNADHVARANVHHSQVLLRYVLGTHDVRRNREDDLVLSALLVSLSEEVAQDWNLGQPGITAE